MEGDDDDDDDDEDDERCERMGGTLLMSIEQLEAMVVLEVRCFALV